MTAEMSYEEQVRHIADRLAISDLVATYAAAVDDRDFDAIMGMFTTDGALARPPWEARGSVDLDAFYRRAIGRYDWTVHAVHGHAAEIDATDPDRASGFVGCHAEHALEGEVVVAALRYRDQYARVDGRWLFARREVQFAHVGVAPHMAAVARRETSVRWPGEALERYGIG